MDDLRAALEAAFEEAGVPVPADLATFSSEGLDSLVSDKRLRGKCKSALVRYRKSVGADLHAAPAPAPEPAPEPTAAPEPAPAATAEPAAAAPEPVAAPEPPAVAEPTVEVVPASPMSAELAELFAGVQEAFAAAGVALPADPLNDSLEALDALDNKAARAKCKSALVKFKRVAQAEGWQAGGTRVVAAPAVVAPAAPVVEASAPEPVAPVAAPEPELEPVEEPELIEASPMSAELAELYAAVQAAFGAAGVAVPADPLNGPLDALDEGCTDKALRAKCKSSLVKFKRAAQAEGWQPGGVRAPRAARPAVVASAPVAAAAPAAASADSSSSAAPAVPAGGNDLYLLTGGAWRKLGTATAVASRADEIVNRSVDGGLARVTNQLTLQGSFDVPADLYNNWCWLAHRGHVMRAYYISHVGDVAKKTRTSCLKVDQDLTYDEFAAQYSGTGQLDRPTADGLRVHRFGRLYKAFVNVFAGRPDRLG